MVDTLIKSQALGEDPNHIKPIVDNLLNNWVHVLYKRKAVSKIVSEILDNKELRDKEETPLIKISKKLQHFISAIRVVYSNEIRREVLWRFVPILFGIINKELRQQWFRVDFDNPTVINSRTRVRLIRLQSKKKK